MMTPLEQEQRSQGGRNRARNQDPETRKFQALLAASSRPLKNDVNMTPEQTVAYFRELQAAHPWLYLFIVGADRHTISHRLTDDAVLSRLRGFSVIGFLGLIMLGTRLQVYGKPLKRGVKVIEDLDRVGREYLADALLAFQQAAHEKKLPPIGEK